MKDYFSAQSSGYAQFRPTYPPELFQYLVSVTHARELAWDCGTGNGQTAIELCRCFKAIYASDISSQQLTHAAQAPNIIYANEPAESVSLENNSVDLITVSQAFHWFEHEQFYSEVKRVANQKAILAIWSYSLLHIDAFTDGLILKFYNDTLNGFWDEARRHVDEGYINIPFPFTTIPSPTFSIRVRWSAEQLGGYLNTWSAVQKYIRAHHVNPVEPLLEAICEQWPAGHHKDITFPLAFKAARVHN